MRIDGAMDDVLRQVPRHTGPCGFALLFSTRLNPPRRSKEQRDTRAYHRPERAGRVVGKAAHGMGRARTRPTPAGRSRRHRGHVPASNNRSLERVQVMLRRRHLYAVPQGEWFAHRSEARHTRAHITQDGRSRRCHAGRSNRSALRGQGRASHRKGCSFLQEMGVACHGRRAGAGSIQVPALDDDREAEGEDRQVSFDGPTTADVLVYI
jgi:hypothetical protein